MYLSALVRSGDGGALVALPLREPVRVVARGRRRPGRHRGPLECQGVRFMAYAMPEPPGPPANVEGPPWRHLSKT